MSDTVFVSNGGTVSSVTASGSTRPTYRDAGLPMASGTVVARRRPTRRPPAAERDPVVEWLGSAEASRHHNHWVALNPETGEFLGRADDLPDLRRWQAAGALIVFVDPPSNA
jgi:hypothetical protein